MKLKRFNTINEKKKEFIKGMEMKKGALHKQLGYDEDEKIPAGIIKKIIDGAIGTKIKVNGEDKTITSLMKKRANLANTLKKINEDQQTENYMFFGNLETMKRLVDELLEMDKTQIDELLKEHDWASDHISVSTENLEQVFDFIANVVGKSNEYDNVQVEPDVKSFNDFKDEEENPEV